MTLSFTIEGEPCGKGRPRFSRIITKNGKEYVKTHTPKKTAQYEELVRIEYLSQIGSIRFTKDTVLSINVKAYLTIPKGTSKWKIPYMEQGIIRPMKKPDWDNIGKIITDALNEMAFHDDVQFVEGTVEKYYSLKPRAEVSITELPCVTSKITKKEMEIWLKSQKMRT